MKLHVSISIVTVIIGVILIAVFQDVSTALYGMFAIIIGIICLVLFLLKPFYGLLLVIIINQVDFLISLPNYLTGGRLIGAIVAIGWFMKYFCRKKTIFFDLIKINKITLFFIASMLVSTLLSSYPTQSFIDFTKLTLLILMVYFIQDFIEDKKKLNLFIMTIAISVGIGSLVGIIQYESVSSGNYIANDPVIGEIVLQADEGAPRVAGLSLNPNGYGLMLLSGIPLLLFFALHYKRIVLKSISLLLLITTIISLALTLSRISIIGLLSFFIIYLYFVFRNRSLDKNQMTILLSIVVVFTLISSVFLTSLIFTRDLKFEDESSTIRYSIFLKSIRLFIENPLFGIGFSNLELLNRFHSIDGSVYGWPAHDIISGAFVATGVIGTVLIIWMVYITLNEYNTSISHFKFVRDEYFMNLCIILKSAFIAFIITGFGNTVIFQRIFWIYIALAAVIHRWSMLMIGNNIKDQHLIKKPLPK